MQGSSHIIKVNKIQSAIINTQNVGMSIGDKQITRENEHDIIVIIPAAKMIKIMIKRNTRNIRKNKTDITRKMRELPSTTYKVKRQPNIPQI